ncbi:MAG: hypothetical protein R2826_01720 [Thermoleophilia bacterium]
MTDVLLLVGQTPLPAWAGYAILLGIGAVAIGLVAMLARFRGERRGLGALVPRRRR